MEEYSMSSLMEDVVQFLDVSGNMQRVKDTACKFHTMSKEILIYRFELVIDAVHLIETSASLGNFLLFQPIRANALFQKVVGKAIKELGLLSPHVSESQVSVRTKLTSLPRSRATEIETYNQLSCCGKGYVCCTGVVLGKTETSKYTQSTRYICTDKCCEGSEGNHFIRMHVPGALEFETIRNDFKCRFCGHILEEVVSCRHLSDKMIAEIIPEKYLKYNNLARFKQQTVALLLRDELTVKLKIGQKYTIIGILRNDLYSDRIITAIEVNNVLENRRYLSILKNDGQQLSIYWTPIENASIPKSMQLYCNREYNFPKMLAYFFGGHICPPGTFMKLKLSCLLSLASFLHEQFSSEDIPLQNICMGGSLLLASGGICYVGDVRKLKKQTFERLQSVLSSGKVLIDIDSKYTKGLAVTTEQPLCSTIWGYVDKFHLKKPREEFLGGGEVSCMSRNLAEAFSIVQITDSDQLSHTEEVDFHISYQTLQISMEGAKESLHFPLSFNDFEKYFKHIQKIHVKMSPGAENLLHEYYLATRRARNSTDVSIITTNTLSTLISMAQSHARLCLRTSVEEEDALEVILLYEESLTAMFGPSILSIPPVSHISANFIKDYLDNQKNRFVLKMFQARLQQFSGLHRGYEE